MLIARKFCVKNTEIRFLWCQRVTNWLSSTQQFGMLSRLKFEGLLHEYKVY